LTLHRRFARTYPGPFDRPVLKGRYDDGEVGPDGRVSRLLHDDRLVKSSSTTSFRRISSSRTIRWTAESSARRGDLLRQSAASPRPRCRSHQEHGLPLATRSGITIAIHEIQVPREKKALLETGTRMSTRSSISTDGPHHRRRTLQGTVEIWSETTKKIETAIKDRMPEYGSEYMAVRTKGNITQIRQMAACAASWRPNGKVIELPSRFLP